MIMRGCHFMAEQVVQVLPVDDEFVEMRVFAMCVLAAVWTTPLQKWVHVSRMHLCILSGYMIFFLQYVAAWAIRYAAGPRLGVWVVAVPNHCASVGIVTYGMWHFKTNNQWRTFVWDLYVWCAPCLLLPQICLMIIGTFPYLSD